MVDDSPMRSRPHFDPRFSPEFQPGYFSDGDQRDGVPRPLKPVPAAQAERTPAADTAERPEPTDEAERPVRTDDAERPVPAAEAKRSVAPDAAEAAEAAEAADGAAPTYEADRSVLTPDNDRPVSTSDTNRPVSTVGTERAAGADGSDVGDRAAGDRAAGDRVDEFDQFADDRDGQREGHREGQPEHNVVSADDRPLEDQRGGAMLAGPGEVTPWRNPYVIALAVVGVGLICVGGWLFERAYSAFNEGIAIQTQGDFASAQVAMYSGPLVMLFGAAVLVGVTFLVAVRWRPRPDDQQP